MTAKWESFQTDPLALLACLAFEIVFLLQSYVTGIWERLSVSWFTPRSSALRRMRSPSSLRNSSPLLGAKARPMPAPTRQPSAKMPSVPNVVAHALDRSSRPMASRMSSLSMSCRYLRALSPRLRISFTFTSMTRLQAAGRPRVLRAEEVPEAIWPRTPWNAWGKEASERGACRSLARLRLLSGEVRKLALHQWDERDPQSDLHQLAGHRRKEPASEEVADPRRGEHHADGVAVDPPAQVDAAGEIVRLASDRRLEGASFVDHALAVIHRASPLVFRVDGHCDLLDLSEK